MPILEELEAKDYNKNYFKYPNIQYVSTGFVKYKPTTALEEMATSPSLYSSDIVVETSHEEYQKNNSKTLTIDNAAITALKKMAISSGLKPEKQFFFKPQIKGLDKPSLCNRDVNSDLDLSFDSIDRIGFEIEGAWVEKKENLHEDASFSPHDFGHLYQSVGEYVSHPISSFVQFKQNLIENWPDGYSSKCGFHLHFSLNSAMDYSLCMGVDFYKQFRKNLYNWAKKNNIESQDFWDRLDGHNRYCQNIFMPDEQSYYNAKGINRLNRRTQLHYCYNQTKTIECRVLPAFSDPLIAISVTYSILNFIQKYLSNINKNQIKPLIFSKKILMNNSPSKISNNFILPYISQNNSLNVFYRAEAKGLLKKCSGYFH